MQAPFSVPARLACLFVFSNFSRPHGWRILWVPQRIPKPSSLGQHFYLLWRSRQCISRSRWKSVVAVEVLNTTAGEFAGGGILISHARRIITRPTKATRTIRLFLLAVATEFRCFGLAHHGSIPAIRDCLLFCVGFGCVIGWSKRSLP